MINRKAAVRLFLLFSISSLLCGCVSNDQSVEETQITLQFHASSFELQNEAGKTFSYDGEDLAGTMVWELVGESEGELYVSIPDSSSFSGKSDDGRYSVTLENREYSRGFSAAGVQEFQLSKENGIVLNGSDISFKLSMDAASLPGVGLIRFQGCAEETVHIMPTDEEFHVSGAIPPLWITITNSELGKHDANIIFLGTEVQLDLSKLDESIVIVTDSGEVSTEVHTNH